MIGCSSQECFRGVLLEMCCTNVAREGTRAFAWSFYLLQCVFRLVLLKIFVIPGQLVLEYILGP